MSIPLAEALLIIGEHPLCSVTIEQSDGRAIWFRIENDQNDDYASADELAAILANYDETQAPYRLAVLLPQEVDEYDPEPQGWQAPTINERNSLALAYA